MSLHHKDCLHPFASKLTFQLVKLEAATPVIDLVHGSKKRPTESVLNSAKR